MIALSIAAVLVAAMATYVAHRYLAMRVELERERIAATAMANDRAFDGFEDRLRQLESAGPTAGVQALESRLAEIGDAALQSARALNERDAEHSAAIQAAADKYDKIITHGINEMREIVKPIDAHFKAMVNRRASAAVSKGASNGR